MTDLPDGWGSRPLSEVLEESIGGIWGNEPGSAEVDVSVLRVTEMKADGRLEPSTAARRSVSAKQVASRELRVGDIILEKSGGGPKSPVGRVGIIDSTTAGYLFSNFMQLLRPATEMVQPDFLFQFLVYFQATGQTAPMQTATTNIRNIKMPDYLASGVPLPPLAEQQRIVEILEEQFSRLDAALASIRTVREKAAAFRQSLLHAAFGGEFSEEPNGEWKVEPLSNIAELSLGVMLDRAKDTGESQVPYLANINVRWGSFETDKLKTMQVLPNQVDRATVRFGDVVVCEGGEPGRCAIWRGENGIAIQKALHRVRPMGELISIYLYYFFEFRFRGVQSDELFTGTTIRHLPKEKLATLEIPLPSVGEQRRIVSTLEEQFSRLGAALAIANQLEARIASERRSLLHAAFSGTLTAHWRETHNG